MLNRVYNKWSLELIIELDKMEIFIDFDKSDFNSVGIKSLSKSEVRRE